MSKLKGEGISEGAWPVIAIGGPIVGGTAGPLLGYVVATAFKLDIETVTTMTTLSCIIMPIIAGLIGASLSTRKK